MTAGVTETSLQGPCSMPNEGRALEALRVRYRCIVVQLPWTAPCTISLEFFGPPADQRNRTGLAKAGGRSLCSSLNLPTRKQYLHNLFLDRSVPCLENACRSVTRQQSFRICPVTQK